MYFFFFFYISKICIEKIIFENLVQTPNKSRRFRKNWLIKDKKLISINDEIVLKNIEKEKLININV